MSEWAATREAREWLRLVVVGMGVEGLEFPRGNKEEEMAAEAHAV
jgi:hypothetical protein